jgi:hypothetical protein
MLGEKKGLRWLIIPNPNEGLTTSLTLRNLETRENRDLLSEELISFMKKEA